MIKECLPKVGIKVSHIRTLFLVSLLFAAVINPYSVFKFLTFNVLVYVYVHTYGGTQCCCVLRLEQCQSSLTECTEENKKLLDINQKLRKQASTIKLQHDQ